MPRAATVDAHGNILIAGQSISGIDDLGLPTRYTGYLMKRNPAGDWASPFGGNYLLGDDPWQGIHVWQPKGSSPQSAVSGVKVLASGRILVGGHHNNRLFVARLSSTGKFDRRFGPWRGRKKQMNRGMIIANFGGKKCRCVSDGVIATDRRGRIYQAGTSLYPCTDRIATIVVVRYFHNGAIDRSFGKNGFARTVRNPWARALSVVVERNGRVVVAGRYGPENDSRLMLLRFCQAANSTGPSSTKGCWCRTSVTTVLRTGY